MVCEEGNELIGDTFIDIQFGHERFSGNFPFRLSNRSYDLIYFFLELNVSRRLSISLWQKRHVYIPFRETLRIDCLKITSFSELKKKNGRTMALWTSILALLKKKKY